MAASFPTPNTVCCIECCFHTNSTSCYVIAMATSSPASNTVCCIPHVHANSTTTSNTTSLTRPSPPPSQHQLHAPKFHHISSPAVYLPSQKALAPQSMPIKAKPMLLEKPQAAATITPKAVAQAVPDSQLSYRQPQPYSHLQSTDSCIPDLVDDCVACLDQASDQRPGSASHSGPTPLPATQQPTPQGPAEVRTSTMPDILAATRSSIQPRRPPQTQLAQPPALNDKLSSRHSEVQCQAAELDQLPNALPHPVPQKLHLVSNAGDAEAQTLEHRRNQIHAEEQHGKRIHAQKQHERLVQAKQASQKQTPIAELPLPLEQVLPRPPEAKPKH